MLFEIESIILELFQGICAVDLNELFMVVELKRCLSIFINSFEFSSLAKDPLRPL